LFSATEPREDKKREDWKRSYTMMLFVTILFKVYSECLTKEALEVLGDFKIGGQIIYTVKYADDLVLLAKEEKMLQGIIDKLIEIGRCYGMEMTVEKTK
jgi:hypothetical protein